MNQQYISPAVTAVDYAFEGVILYFGTSDSNKVALTAENYFQFAGQRGANCGRYLQYDKHHIC
jgi:hypothetical protein